MTNPPGYVVITGPVRGPVITQTEFFVVEKKPRGANFISFRYQNGELGRAHIKERRFGPFRSPEMCLTYIEGRASDTWTEFEIEEIVRVIR